MLSKLDCTGSCGSVVEVGCGYGTFTIPAAQQAIGPIYAFDIDAHMVASTVAKAQQMGLTNIVPVVRDVVAEGTGLPDESVGYVMLFNILHIETPEVLLREAHRILHGDGRLGVIHWRSDIPTPRGPSLDIRPTLAQCRAWAEQAGFEWVREEALCCCSWHWGFIMRRASRSETR